MAAIGGSGVSASNKWQIGGWGAGGFGGKVYNALIWDKALSDEEVTAVYDAAYPDHA